MGAPASRSRTRCTWLWPATSTSGPPISKPSSRGSSWAGTAPSWHGSPSSAKRRRFSSASEVTALIVNANRLGLTGKVALRECRRISPSTAVVVVATTAAHGLKDALEGGATAFVSWPASPEVLRRALHSGRETTAPASQAVPIERGGVVDEPRSAARRYDTRAPRTTDRTKPPSPASRIDPRPASWPRPGRRRPPRSPAWSISPSWTPTRSTRGDGGARPTTRWRTSGTGSAARLSPEILEAYDRALRGGRQPAVVRLVASVCSGCHVRLHSTLEQKVRRRRGVGPCPHCLRLVYDPAWLDAAARVTELSRDAGIRRWEREEPLDAADPGAWLLLAAATRLAAIAAALVVAQPAGPEPLGGVRRVRGGLAGDRRGRPLRPRHGDRPAGPPDPPRGLGADPRLLGGRPLGLVPRWSWRSSASPSPSTASATSPTRARAAPPSWASPSTCSSARSRWSSWRAGRSASSWRGSS